MLEDLIQQTLFHQLQIKIANGGYIVTAYVIEENGELVATTAVFTDVRTMQDYVGRIAISWEGMEQFSKLGPLRCQDETEGR